MGRGYEVFLWPVNTGLLTSLAALLGCALALDRDDRTGDWLAGGCVALALASSPIGVAVAAGMALEVAPRRRGRRRWPVVAVPVALYVLWRIGYDPPATVEWSNAGRVLSFGADTAAAGAGGIVSLDMTWGRILLLGGIAALVWRCVLPARRMTPRLAALICTALAVWLLTALGRAGVESPSASRYVFVNGFLLVVIATEAARGARLANPRAAALVAGLVVIAIPAGLLAVRDGGRAYRDVTKRVAAEIGALEVARGIAAPGFRVDPVRAPQIIAGDYFRAVRRMGGTPAWSLRELRTGPERERIAADAALVGAERVRPVGRQGACPHAAAIETGAELAFPPGGELLLQTTGEGAVVRLRRFSSYYGAPLGETLAARSVVALRAPRDRAPDRWRARVDGAGVRRCVPR
jgi:hypothetical protein